jgi:pSer/pThr/pTyr-binding forkhead associated (FHA) protein
MPSPSQQHHLLIIQDDKGERSFPLYGERYSIGRDADCDIQLISQFVSRHHAMLQQHLRDDGSHYYEIIDGDAEGQRSSNGLLINGRKRRSRSLENKDEVVFGPQARVIYHFLERDAFTTQPPDDFDITLINPGSIDIPEDATNLEVWDEPTSSEAGT